MLAAAVEALVDELAMAAKAKGDNKMAGEMAQKEINACTARLHGERLAVMGPSAAVAFRVDRRHQRSGAATAHQHFARRQIAAAATAARRRRCGVEGAHERREQSGQRRTRSGG